ncbi:MAG: hypothetical protein ABIQ35_03810 [Verrucomicrobiota bacterium]
MSITKTSNETQWGGFITNLIRKNKTTVGVAPVLGSAKRFPHGAFQFQVRLASGSAYELQSSSDMKTWKSIHSDTAVGETVEYLDTEAFNFSYRFYRGLSGGATSKNILGYATLSLPPGFAMISNPFNALSSRVETLFPEMPEGMTISKFDTSLFRLTNNSVKNGKWTNPNELFVPGEGAIVFNPTTDFKNLNFVGDVSQGRLTNPIPAGMSIRSSLVPQPGRLHTDLGFPIGEGDVINMFDRDQQKYTVHPYSAEAWDRNPPTIGVGESFWIGKKHPGNWVRNLSIV